MNDKALRGVLEIMTQTPGIRACALVRTVSGDVWLHAGNAPELDEMARAAAEHWQLHGRRSKAFQSMGPLTAGIMIHMDGRLTLLPCGNELILLTVTDPNPSLDWERLQRRAHNLARFITRSASAAAQRGPPPSN